MVFHHQAVDAGVLDPGIRILHYTHPERNVRPGVFLVVCEGGEGQQLTSFPVTRTSLTGPS